MKRKKISATELIIIITAAVFFLFSYVFAFWYMGHRMLAMFLFGIGAVLVLFLLLGRISSRYKKKVRIVTTIAVGLLVLGVCAFTLAEVQVVRAAKTDDNPQADYLIVLGAGVNGKVPSLSLRNRLDAALEYMKMYPDSIAVVSGGQGPGEDITEAQAMFDFLVDSGISDERIIKEEKSESTRENIVFSLEKIQEIQNPENLRIAIVTSEYHLFRAKSIAEQLGFEPIGIAAKTTMPTLKLNHYIREAFAVIFMFFGMS